MTAKEIQDALKAKPSYREIDFAGQERGFLLGKRAFDLAKQKEGLEPEDVIGDEGEEDLSENLDRVARVLYTGFLPFPDGRMEIEDVSALLDMEDVQRFGGLMQEIFGEPGEAAGKDTGADEADG